MTATVVGTVCAFGKRCGAMVTRAGGLDQHHPQPLSWGGSPDQELLVLCPNHHRRQHALLATLQARGGELSAVGGAVFHADELPTARLGYAGWMASGRPPIHGEPAPAID
jgi:hypothetical protein